jgi:predicted alpha/beta superfamily hydrolase
MKTFVYICICGILSGGIISCTRHRNPTVPAIYSNFVKDSFELYIDLPPGYQPNQDQYAVAFYMDANLKMGQEIRRQIKLAENAENLKQVIFVGVGHIGPYRKLRRRDFIPPMLKNQVAEPGHDENFGHADVFYQFLVLELIPYIRLHYPNSGQYSLIGHSFSGLFAFYCMYQPNPVFKNYVALSPSLWANYYNIFEYEARLSQSQKNISGTLYHACGTGEWMNKVLSTSRKMNKKITDGSYPQIQYIYQEHPGKNHNGVVPVSLKYVLENLKFYTHEK